MLAYNKNKLDTWNNRQMTEEVAALGLITETEKLNVLSRFPAPFFTPNTIVRIGLGFATMVAVSTFFSFIRLLLGINMNDFFSNLIFGAALVFLLEHLIRKKYHYKSGIDDVLLYQAFGIIMGGIFDIFDKVTDPSIAMTSIAAVLAIAATVRYADRLMAGVALAAFMLFVHFVLIRINRNLGMLSPCVIFTISLITWFVCRKLAKAPTLFYYRHCFEFLELVSLMAVGICTNYYVVMEGWFNVNKYDGTGWKWYYIITTAVVPLVTIVSGFLKKDKKRIRIGAFMVVAAVMTYHHYLSSTPVETLCIIYGSVLLILSYWLLKYYKARPNGVSFMEKQDGRSLFELESLMIGAGVSLVLPEQQTGRFGGGDFGGAGSGGRF